MGGQWVGKRGEEMRKGNLHEWGENWVAELIDGTVRVEEEKDGWVDKEWRGEVKGGGLWQVNR